MTTTDTTTTISDVARSYLRLHLTSDVGPIRLRNLLDRFGSIEGIRSTSRAELEQVDRIGPRVAESIFNSRNDETVDREVERAQNHGIRILCAEDEDYPTPLKMITDPPICLYIKGDLIPTDAVAIAIVGTRRCSHYGREQARRFGEMLASAGFTIVSGLARGIDGEAHLGALRAGGRTIAVLGHGLATVYPPEHQKLAEQVMDAGALISEFPVTAGPEPKNFPRRNRIITGLSLGVIVVEAGKKSGALITARLAHDYNREVFAVPGRVDRPQETAGVHHLIREGHAKLITCLEDVLDELAEVGEIMGRFDSKPKGEESASSCDSTRGLGPEEQAVFEAVRGGAEETDAIASHCGLNSAQTLSALTSLQLKARVRQIPGGRFVVR